MRRTSKPRREAPSILGQGVFLLGAGASFKAGVPIASQFFEKIKTHLASLPQSTAAPLISELESIPKILGVPSEEQIGLEPLYEAIDDCLDAYHQDLPQPNGLKASRALERLHYEIKRTIQLECDIKDAARTKYLHRLLKHLKSFAPFPIASLNYDNIIEISCANLGLKYAEPVFESSATGRDIELIKIHGSVTWFLNRDGDIARVDGISEAAIRSTGELRSPTLETPLIYPSRRKMPIESAFIRNALRFQELLKDKRRTACVAIGYSFPDAHLLKWLHDALKSRPELILYVVDPHPGFTISNLTTKAPTVPWMERLRIVPMKFEDAIAMDGGLEAALYSARPLSPEFLSKQEKPLWTGKTLRISTPKPSGLAASLDGKSLFLSSGVHGGSVLRAELAEEGSSDAKVSLYCKNLRNPRGIAVAPNDDLYVVENRLLPFRRPASIGAGNIVRVSKNGRRLDRLIKLPFFKLIGAWLNMLQRRVRGSDKWKSIPQILRWPTDLVCRSDDVLYVTEARSVARLARGKPVERIIEPELTFNLHGIDLAPDGALITLEQGIAQTYSWGRLRRFVDTPTGVESSSSDAIEGLTRLMGVCVASSHHKVIIAQCLTWPKGGLWILDYPSMKNARFLGGFDFPQKLAFVAHKNLLAIGDQKGILLMSVAELIDAASNI